MNRKKLAIATIVTGLILSLGIVSKKSVKSEIFKSNSLKNIPINTGMANHFLFDSIEEVEQYTDLIVIGKTKTDFAEGQPVIKRFPNGGIEDYYTVTEFTVNKMLKGADKLETNQLSNVLKNSNNSFEDFYNITTFKVNKVFKELIGSNNISVIQSAVLMSESGMNYVESREDYSLLKKNSYYLLFLAQIDSSKYSIISLNQGKFSLDKTDQEEQAIEQKDSQYSNLKAQALSKYKDRLDNF
jgi:hypothetical protein